MAMLGLNHHLRDLRQDGGRVALTVLGVVWGTMAVTILVAFGESASHTVLRAEQGMGKGIVVVQNGSTSIPFEGLPVARPIRLMGGDVEALKTGVPAIAGISAEYVRGGLDLTYRGKVHSVPLSAVEPQYGTIRNCPPQPGGRFINEMDIKQRRRVAFLGDALKGKVFGAEDAVGKAVLLRGTPFTVVGVMRPKLQLSSYQTADQWRVFIPFSTYEAMWGRQPLSAIVYLTPSRAEADLVRGQVCRVLARRHRFDPEDRFALSIWDTTEGEEITEGIHLGVRGFMGMIGVVTLIVAGVGVGNVMYVLVKSRTREIGIKVAVGAKPSDITMYHLIEGFVIVVLGGGFGLLASWLLIVGLNHVPLDEEALRYFGRPKMSVFTMVVVATVLGLVGLFAGLFPARRAALTDPVEALRYE
jgi:putative ABC transport system permease protein